MALAGGAAFTQLPLPPQPAGFGGDSIVTLPGEGAPMPGPDGTSRAEMADGSVEIDLSPGSVEKGRIPPEAPFDANLAEYLDSQILTRISSQLLEGVQRDIESMAPWLKDYTDACAALGIRYEDRTYPFPRASGVHASILIRAIVRCQAMLRSELLPPRGPVKVAEVGSDDAQTARSPMALSAKAQRKQDYFNFHLTSRDGGWYTDYDAGLMHLVIGGTLVRKCYRDPLQHRLPVSRYVPLQNLIISYSAVDANSCGRVTERLVVDPADVQRMMISGEWRTVDLTPVSLASNPAQQALDKLEGRVASMRQDDQPREFFEIHCDLDIEHPDLQHKLIDYDEAGEEVETESGMPLPYIVTIDKETTKVMALRRNWRADDPLFLRQAWFAAYRLIPGFGFFGFGYAHLLGQNQRAATTMLRQFIDATTLNMFPGGVTSAKSVRPEDNRNPIGPCEWREIDAQGGDLRAAFVPLPYKEPPAAAPTILQLLIEEGEKTGNIAELAVGEGAANMPVGTMMALIDRATKPEAAIVQRSYVSLRGELAVFERMFGEDPQATYPYQLDGRRGVAMGADFDGSSDTLPVADPNIPTKTQRLARAQGVLTLATSSPPGMYDLREANRQMLSVLEFSEQEIGLLLPEPAQAFSGDVVSEIMAAIQSKAIKAAPEQDHLSHIKAKVAALQMPGVANMPAQQILMGNIAEHYALLFRDLVQQQVGADKPLPPPGQPLPPQVSNQISRMVAGTMQGVVAHLQAEAGVEGTAAASMELQVRLKEIEQQEADSKRKTGQAIIQNRTEILKLQGTTADNAAERQAEERLLLIQERIAKIELERAQLAARSSVYKADRAAEAAEGKVGADHHRAEADVTVAREETRQAQEATRQAEQGTEQAQHQAAAARASAAKPPAE